MTKTFKELKNQISIIRKPEEINKEYSDLVIQLGQWELELAAMQKTEEKHSTRIDEITNLKEKNIQRIIVISDEMNEAQKEIQRKKEEQTKESTNDKN